MEKRKCTEGEGKLTLIVFHVNIIQVRAGPLTAAARVGRWRGRPAAVPVRGRPAAVPVRRTADCTAGILVAGIEWQGCQVTSALAGAGVVGRRRQHIFHLHERGVCGSRLIFQQLWKKDDYKICE